MKKLINEYSWKFFGIFFLVLPFVPLEKVFGKIRGFEGAGTPFEWFKSLLIVLVLSFIFTAVISDSVFENFLELITRLWLRIKKCFTFLSLVLLFIFLLLISYLCFSNKPYVLDSIVQLFHAKIFSLGLLKAQSSIPYGFILIQNTIFDSTGVYSQYPFGHSLILALGELVNLVWLVPILLSVGSAFYLSRFTKLVYGEAESHFFFFLLIICPFFLFLGASFMNHVSTMFFLSAFLYFYALWEKQHKVYPLIISAVSIAFAFHIRPLAAVTISIPFVFFGLSFAVSNNLKRHLVLPSIFGFLVASLFFIYNYLVNGDPFLAGYVKLWGKSHGLGFHVSPWGEAHTLITGLRNELTDLLLLSARLFEWPVSSLLPVSLFLIFYSKLSVWDKRLSFCIIILPLAYFFYWHRDAQLGPRFMYSSLIFILPLTARILVLSFSKLNKAKFNFFKKEIALRKVYFFLFLVCLFHSMVLTIPLRFELTAMSNQSLKEDLKEKALSSGIKDGLVFIKVSFGNRLISNLRELGLSASFVETAYLNVDHCMLNQKLIFSKLRKEPKEKLVEEINKLMQSNPKAQRFKVTEDSSLRLYPDRRPDSKCLEEINYDEAGFSIYTPHINSNSPDFKGELVFVKDLRRRNQELKKVYPEKAAYLYNKGEFRRIW